MAAPSLVALLGFIGWSLVLLLLMESIRTKLVLFGEVAANGFDPANSNLSPFMQRLARAHANCVEGLPIFGGLLAASFRFGLLLRGFFRGLRRIRRVRGLRFRIRGGRLVRSHISRNGPKVQKQPGASQTKRPHRHSETTVHKPILPRKNGMDIERLGPGDRGRRRGKLGVSPSSEQSAQVYGDRKGVTSFSDLRRELRSRTKCPTQFDPRCGDKTNTGCWDR